MISVSVLVVKESGASKGTLFSHISVVERWEPRCSPFALSSDATACMQNPGPKNIDFCFTTGMALLYSLYSSKAGERLNWSWEVRRVKWTCERDAQMQHHAYVTEYQHVLNWTARKAKKMIQWSIDTLNFQIPFWSEVIDGTTRWVFGLRLLSTRDIRRPHAIQRRDRVWGRINLQVLGREVCHVRAVDRSPEPRLLNYHSFQHVFFKSTTPPGLAADIVAVHQQRAYFWLHSRSGGSWSPGIVLIHTIKPNIMCSWYDEGLYWPHSLCQTLRYLPMIGTPSSITKSVDVFLAMAVQHANWQLPLS